MCIALPDKSEKKKLQQYWNLKKSLITFFMQKDISFHLKKIAFIFVVLFSERFIFL